MPPEPLSDRTLDDLSVFPLPGTVLFPGTALPLHVFEPRYVAMVERSMATDRAIAITMLHDDADAAAERAPIHEVACAGRIVHCEPLPNARFNILVHGLDRVRLVEELPLASGFRRFRTQRVCTTETRSAGAELARLQSCVLSLRSSVERTDKQLVEVLRTTSDPVALTDILCAVLITDPKTRQLLLGTASLRRRIELLIDAVAEAMIRVGEPPAVAKMN